MIPDEVIEQVQASADTVAIIGEYVKLKRVGARYRGPCPFHQGTHDNFSVTPGAGYVCFVCGEKGSIFTFFQKRLGLDFLSAVRLVAEKSGIAIPEAPSRNAGPDYREPFWEVNASVSEYFQTCLWDTAHAAHAREYLERREISRDVAESVGLGFAPREIGLMRTYLNTLGFDDSRLVECGLLVAPEGATEPRPRFRGRLMFPIFDSQNRTVGFGGRLIGEGEPKYLNSPESPVFSKGKLLYGLNWARNDIRKDDNALVVEGYFDVIRLRAAGVNSVVAPLGTALTVDQAMLLRRLTKNVFLIYDSDVAGQKATFRSGDALLAQGLSVRVVTLPQGEDPDTFVRANGGFALEALRGEAMDIFERKLQILGRAGWFAEIHKKRRALDRLLPTLRATNDEIMRELYLTRAAEVTGVAREVLDREVAGNSPKKVNSLTTPSRAPAQAVRPVSAAPNHFAPGASSERELVRAMLPPDTSRVEFIIEQIGPEEFLDPQYREIYESIIRCGENATLEDVASSLDEDAITTVQELAAGKSPELNVAKTIEASIARLRARDIAKKKADLDRVIPLASGEQQKEMTMQKVRLHKEMMRLLNQSKTQTPLTEK